jgi:phage FluMu protein Com
MAIEFQCTHCKRLLKLKDTCAGLTGECPYCKGVISIPAVIAPKIADVADTVVAKPVADPTVAASPDKTAPQTTEEPEFTPPTKKQLDYARKLGIDIPKGISRSALSVLIDGAKDNAPASEKQKEFLRELGVKFPENIRLNQASMLIDGAMTIRDEVSGAIQQRLEEQWKAAGMLMDGATVEQLLHEIDNRGKPFIIFIMEDDEFHYHDEVPMNGRLLWNRYLSSDDAMYAVISLAANWAKNLDMKAYLVEYDGTLPKIEFTAGELPDDADNVVHLSMGPLSP